MLFCYPMIDGKSQQPPSPPNWKVVNLQFSQVFRAYTPRKLTNDNGKSPFLIGNTSSNGWFCHCHSLVFGGLRELCFFVASQEQHVTHPGKLTWNLKITPLKRKIIFQTSIIVFQPFIFQGVPLGPSHPFNPATKPLLCVFFCPAVTGCRRQV